MPILQWLNREQSIQASHHVPYRLLKESTEYSYGDVDAENMLIQGDNLDALKALLPYYAGKVKCIFIDPPYNTKSAFEHYQDNLEHTKWLEMMYPRLELLRELLAEDGSIWVTIDDNEAHYLKVIMDEIFGRNNFVSNIVWNHRKSVQNDIDFSLSHNHIIIFSKDIKKMQVNRLKVDDEKYDNPDNDPRGSWYPTPFDAPQIRPNLQYEITNPNTGATYLPPKGRHWRTTEKEYKKLLESNQIVFGKTGKSKPQQKRFLTQAQSKGTSIKTWWDDVGTATEATKELQKLFSLFNTPKPERLLHHIIQIATKENELILDSFLGSGTTAAVAHKMGRQYIGIEMGEHAKTHCAERLKKVIDGEQGGISKDVNWQGGGGYRFYTLGEAIFDEDGKINPSIRFQHLAAHIWFSETHTPYNKKRNSPLLGIHNNIAYYLLYNGILGDKRPQGGNVLTSKILKDLPKHNGPKIIYGETTRLGPATLERHNIIFKQTPYDIKAI